MPLALTPEQAAAELRARGHKPHDISPLSGGLWSTAFAFREDGSDYVVRFHERRDDVEKDRFAYRWRSEQLRTPRIVEVGDMPDGGAYGISERAQGAMLDDTDEAGMRAALPSLFTTLDALRDADLSGTSGYGLWHGDGRGDQRTWPDQLLRIADERDDVVRGGVGLAEFDAGFARVRELLPSQTTERHVAHNDLLYRNVIVDRRGIVLLDWGASIFGDWLYDWALLAFWWPWYRARWGGIDIRAEIKGHFRRSGLEVPHLEERLRCCEIHIGIEHIPFQASRGRLDDARWTAARVHRMLDAPLEVSWPDRD